MKQFYCLYSASCEKTDSNGISYPCSFNFYAETSVEAYAFANSIAKSLGFVILDYREVNYED